MWPAASQRQPGSKTDDGVHTDGDGGTSGREKHRSGRTSALRACYGARYGLEKAHANVAWRAGAMGGESTASFRCRRIFWMTLLLVMAAMIRKVPC